jgi:hypothetical protein
MQQSWSEVFSVLKESLTVFADYKGVVITWIVCGESTAWKIRMTLRLKGYNRIARNISGNPETFERISTVFRLLMRACNSLQCNLMVRLTSSFLPFRASPARRGLFYDLSVEGYFPLPDLSGFPPLISPEKDGRLRLGRARRGPSVTSEKSS